MSNQLQQMNFLEILKFLLKKKNFILRTTAIFLLLGILYALSTENRYTSTTLVYPQVGNLENRGGISGLASIAGIDLNSGREGFEIPPNIYPKIVNSIGFRRDLIYTSFLLPEIQDSITYIDYYERIYRPSLLMIAKKYTFGLPQIILNSFRSNGGKNQTTKSIADSESILTLNQNQRQNIDRIAGQLKVEPDYRDGLIRISFNSSNKFVSVQMTQALKSMLESKIIDLKTEKAQADLEATLSEFEKAKNEFEIAKTNLFRFQDANIILTSANSKAELLNLQSEYDIKFGVYRELATQVEKAKMRLNQDRPLFSTIDPITFPDKKSAPKRGAIVVIWTLLGFMFAIGYLISKKYLISIKNE